MMVAVDHVADRRVWKALRQLSLEPGAEIRVDRIGEDDAGRGDVEDGVVVVVADAVEVARHLRDFADRRLLSLLRGGSRRQEREHQSKSEAASHR